MKLLLLCSSLLGFYLLALPSDHNTELAMKEMIQHLIEEAEKKDKEILRFKTALTCLDRQTKRELEKQENGHYEYLQKTVISYEVRLKELRDSNEMLTTQLEKSHWKHDRMNELTAKSIQSRIYLFPRSFKKTDISIQCLK